jgi:predicted ribosome quality control (RQC) complex YloA/Tae2 family protein
MKIVEFIYLNKNYEILIGKNENDNWQILDQSMKTDILFHVSNTSSSYVILKNTENQKKKDIPKQVIKRCACLCKSHSTSKSEINCEINYTFISNCEKGEKIGSVYMKYTTSIFI